MTGGLTRDPERLVEAFFTTSNTDSGPEAAEEIEEFSSDENSTMTNVTQTIPEGNAVCLI